MLQRLHNDDLARALHVQLYKRMVAFCNQYTPEIPAEPVVRTWLNRLYQGDDKLHVLVGLAPDGYHVNAHVLIDVQTAFDSTVIFCHQAQIDDAKSGDMASGVEYLDKLAEYTGASCITMMVAKNTKALQKFGYAISRTAMIKVSGDSTRSDTEDS